MNAEPAPPASPPPAAEPPARRMGVGARLRAYFLTGVLVTAPIGITFYVAWAFITAVDRTVTPLIPGAYNPETYLPFGLPGLGLVVVAVALTMVGALTAGFLGKFIVRTYERVLNRMPVIRGVYSALKQIFETVLAQKSNAFREAVLLEYPRPGIWTIGFLTGEPARELAQILGNEVVNVFVPTTPNPTSGFLLFVPRKDVTPLAMSVDDAIKLVISGGIVVPPEARSAPTPAKSADSTAPG